MRTFKVGKKYKDGAITFEVTGRTENTVKFVEIQHAGRSNERKSSEKRAKIKNWINREVFIVGDRTIEA